MRIIKPTYTALGFDLIISCIYYGAAVYYTYAYPESYITNAIAFLLPLLIIVGIVGLVNKGAKNLVDKDPKYKRRYKRYFDINAAMYFGFMIACAALAWYWWAALFFAKSIMFMAASSDYSDWIEKFELNLEEHIDEDE